ncbi:hypothetical protein HNR26_002338 [Rhizobium rosettiformans]|uniref:Uncharacterized protein n=2 Tax=Rhizobium rosettiformans TaxID=1368430 RepID=A0A4S8PZ01_9HYPH|nr:hypothetical protein [Rhizobium rosettiformans]MBB5276286.1 hypothetical protein [Rhizobium rosettiformans]THV36918.1 hypothetical protein FAA86_10510 [Rhizobium rosettiformans W3]
MLPHRISGRSLSVLVDGRFRTITNQAVNFDTIVDLLRSGTATEDEVRDLIDIPTFIKKATFGRVEVTEGEVIFNGLPQTGYMAERILKHLHAGLDIGPYARFLDNLMDNPTQYVREDLFKWVEAGDMPFTEDGCFLAYKYVQDDYYSAHSGANGKVFHGLGEFVTMPRSECDLSRSSCSTGLHFCSFKYLGHYNTNRRIIIVKVHPSNVTAIPPDYGAQKGRCCAYTVVGELPQDQVHDILRGRLVVRSFKEFRFGEVAQGDDELLNAQVTVDNFERPPEPEDDDQGVEEEHEEDLVEDEGEYDSVSPTEIDPEDLEPVVAPPAPVEKPVVKAKTKPAKKGKGKVTFTHNDVTYSPKKILKLIEENGQRGTSKKTGIPRTTLQSWLSIIKG